jgi:hypothetical protein
MPGTFSESLVRHQLNIWIAAVVVLAAWVTEIMSSMSKLLYPTTMLSSLWV